MSMRRRPTLSGGVITETALVEDLLNLLQVSKHLLYATVPMYDDLIRRHLHDSSIQVPNGHVLFHPAVRPQQPHVGVYTPLAISLTTGTTCIVDSSAVFARCAAAVGPWLGQPPVACGRGVCRARARLSEGQGEDAPRSTGRACVCRCEARAAEGSTGTPTRTVLGPGSGMMGRAGPCPAP